MLSKSSLQYRLRVIKERVFFTNHRRAIQDILTISAKGDQRGIFFTISSMGHLRVCFLTNHRSFFLQFRLRVIK